MYVAVADVDLVVCIPLSTTRRRRITKGLESLSSSQQWTEEGLYWALVESAAPGQDPLFFSAILEDYLTQLFAAADAVE